MDPAACTRDCETCGRHLPPVEWELFGQKRYAPSNCPECAPKQEAERAQTTAWEQQDKKVERYKGAFPFKHDATFANFERRPGGETIYRFAKGYADGLPKPALPGLVFFGDPGNGKTHLAAAIVATARQQHLAVAWIHTPTWLRYLGTLEGPARESLIAIATEADLLVLDELGAGKLTASRAEWLLSILETVYQQRRNFIATTNLSPGKLATELTPPEERATLRENDVPSGARLMDRLAEIADFIPNQASSYRMELARRRMQEATPEVPTDG